MLLDVFESDLKKLAAGFGANLKEERIEAYWDHLQHIPSDDWVRIMSFAIRKCERFPSIKFFLECYEETRSESPDKEDPGAGDRDCPDCHGEGRLYIKRTYPDMIMNNGEPMIYEMMARCGTCCRHRGNKKIPAVDRARLEANPNVIEVEPNLNEQLKEPAKKLVTEDDFDFLKPFDVEDDEERRFKEEERLAILAGQAEDLKSRASEEQ